MNAAEVSLVSRAQAAAVAEVARSAEKELLIATPFISIDGVAWLAQEAGIRPDIGIRLLTSATSVALHERSCDPDALIAISKCAGQVDVSRLPALHAKVYVSDAGLAVVTSANLTRAGLFRNWEYGVLLREAGTVAAMRSDLEAYMALATPLPQSTLLELSRIVASAPPTTRRDPETMVRIRATLADIDQHVAAAHVRGRSEHSVFAEIILFVLRRSGPLATAAMHPLVQELIPELCDDGVDRVIDGVHYGKRWKHMVRTAQQHLKRAGLIQLNGELWGIV